MKKKIETDFIRYIADKYSPNPGATSSKNDDEKSSNDQDADSDNDDAVLEQLLHKYKKIRDEYEYYSLQSKRR